MCAWLSVILLLLYIRQWDTFFYAWMVIRYSVQTAIGIYYAKFQICYSRTNYKKYSTKIQIWSWMHKHIQYTILCIDSQYRIQMNICVLLSSDLRIDFKQFIRIIEHGFCFRLSFIRFAHIKLNKMLEQNGIVVDHFRNCIMQNMRDTLNRSL